MAQEQSQQSESSTAVKDGGSMSVLTNTVFLAMTRGEMVRKAHPTGEGDRNETELVGNNCRGGYDADRI